MAPLGIAIALLDTSVLFPQHLRNTLLYAAAQEVYQPIWSGRILAELTSVLRARRHLTAAQLDHLVQQMRRSFPFAEIEDYEYLIPDLSIHPNDRHVLAAAIRGQADVLVTSNLRHFPQSVVGKHGIDVQSPDAFLLRRLDDAPRLMAAALAEQVAAYRAPPLTLDLLCDRLAPVVPRFATRLRAAPSASHV